MTYTLERLSSVGEETMFRKKHLFSVVNTALCNFEILDHKQILYEKSDFLAFFQVSICYFCKCYKCDLNHPFCHVGLWYYKK